MKTMLFDLESDPFQEQPLEDKIMESRMVQALIEMMDENDAPEEQYVRLELEDVIF